MTDVSVSTHTPSPAPTAETVEAQTNADVERIEAQAESTVEIIEAQAEARVEEIAAQAAADVARIEASADAAERVAETQQENNDTWRTELMATVQTMNSRMEAMQEELSALKASQPTENNSIPNSTPLETESPSSPEQALSVESVEAESAPTPPAKQRAHKEIFL